MTTLTTRTINNDSKAFGISLMLHGLIFAGLLSLGGMAVVEQVKPVIVDLSIFSGPAMDDTPAGGAPQRAVAAHQILERAVDKSVNESITPVKTATLLTTAASSPVALPSSAVKTVSATQGQNGKASGSVTGARADGNSNAAAGTGGSSGSQQLAQQYNRDHFRYIQQLIASKAKYPRAARARNQEGTLVVSFIVMPDGKINHLRVVKSSGYELLDQNALESVQKAAPFPKPPVMAELRVPISYSLSRG